MMGDFYAIEVRETGPRWYSWIVRIADREDLDSSSAVANGTSWSQKGAVKQARRAADKHARTVDTGLPSNLIHEEVYQGNPT